MALNEVKIEERLASLTVWELSHSMLDYIKSTEAKVLKKDDLGKYTEALEKKNQDLKDRYPGIFNMIMRDEDKFDFEKLKWMLSILDKRNEGSMSKEDSDNTVVFRQFEEEVKPKIDWDKEKPNFEKYNKYLNDE